MDGNPTTVLVVDDSVDNRFVLEKVIEGHLPGCRVVQAQSATEALEVVARNTVDVAVVDYQMPGVDGIELCRQLKANPCTTPLPILLVTSHGTSAKLRTEALEAGAADFLSRPFDNEEFAVRVRILLRVRQAENDLRRANDRLTLTVDQRTRALEESEASLRVRVRQQSLLVELGTRVILEPHLDPLFDKACQTLCDGLGVEYAKVLEREPTGVDFSLRAGRGWKPGLVGTARVGVDLDSQAGYTLLEKTPVVVNDLSSEARFSGPALLTEHGVMSGLSTAIGDPNAPFGVLGAHTRARRRFSEDDVAFLQGVSNILGEAIGRRAAELDARANDAKFQSLVENVGIGLCRTLPGGQGVHANPMMARILGYPSVEELLKVPVPDLYVNPGERHALMAKLASGAGEVDAQVRLRRRDGTAVWVCLTATAERDARGEILWFDGVIRDISELKRIEAEREEIRGQLTQAQKVEALGILAGGVAHDFNNLLMVITGLAALALMDLSPDDPAASRFEEIRKAGERAAALTRQLLAFSRRSTAPPRPVDVNHVLGDLEKMLQRLIGEDVEFSFNPGSPLGTVCADPGQVEQLAMNLVLNARDAMPRGGRLTVTTAVEDLGPEAAERFRGSIGPGPHVVITVADTGYGMDEETLNRVFEPFFTTKDPGRGTGLGLSTVANIVGQYGGGIHVQSTPGMGTTFRVALPLCEGAASADDTIVGEASGGSATVLLVDDDRGVRHIARGYLESYGYEVLEASSVADALRVQADHLTPVHLLVTDVVMPGSSGWGLAQEVCRRNPDTRVLFMSGYTDEVVERHGVRTKNVAFIEKPFTREHLTREVRRVLDAACP